VPVAARWVFFIRIPLSPLSQEPRTILGSYGDTVWKKLRGHYDGWAIVRSIYCPVQRTGLFRLLAALTCNKSGLVKEGIGTTRRQRKFSGVKIMIYGHESPAKIRLVPHNIRVVYRIGPNVQYREGAHHPNAGGHPRLRLLWRCRSIRVDREVPLRPSRVRGDISHPSHCNRGAYACALALPG
jgi:hypothetical protein